MSVPRVKITYQDYLQMPEGERWEVLDGDLKMVPTPGSQHQSVLHTLTRALDAYVYSQRLGLVCFAPLDVILDEYSVVQPDLLVILKGHLEIIKPEGVRGAPDLVVEVLSPSTASRDRGVKRHLYARFGVREYWLVDPQERTVEVTSLRDGLLQTMSRAAAGERIESPLFPDLVLAVADLFAE